MSLNYNLTDIKDWPELMDEDGNPKLNTAAIIYAADAVGMHKITEANWREFYVRTVLFENIIQTFMKDENGEDKKLTAEDVKRHIGLVVNAAGASHSKFMTKLKEVIQ